jgi:hypothetical protein
MSIDELLDQVLREADLCLCSHERDRHVRKVAGPRSAGCDVASCGCLWFRPRAGEAA